MSKPTGPTQRNLKLVTPHEQPFAGLADYSASAESLSPVLYTDFTEDRDGPVAVDFMAEDDPRLVLKGRILDQVSDCVYVVFSKRRLGELASVQVLEEELGRSPAWLDVMTAVTGPTIGRRIKDSYDNRTPIDAEKLFSPDPQEVKELQEAWLLMDRAIARRLEIDSSTSPLVEASEESKPWQICTSAIGFQDANRVPEDGRVALNEMSFYLPAGFLMRASLFNPIKAVHDVAANKIIFSATPRDITADTDVTVQFIDPGSSEIAALSGAEDSLTAEINIPPQYSARHSVFGFSSILMKVGK